MSSPAAADHDRATRRLYNELLASWNRHDAGDLAALFTDEGVVIGFDGSHYVGRADIEASLAAIFADHPTGSYVSIVRSVRSVAPDVAILHAVTGLVPHGGSDLNPATNAHQTLVSVQRGDQWRIALFQNTPAQFHGRPEVAAALTEELRSELCRGGSGSHRP
jgi:uncharacterized protein (TIGR02246 family)